MSKTKKQTHKTSALKENRIILLSVFAAVTILVAAFIANGSDYENAWLYMTALWIVLIPAFEMYTKKKKK